MPVREMLARFSSPELAEWMAYENVAGPVNGQYDSEMLTQIHELIQAFGSEDGDFETMPRPWRREG